MSWVLTTTGRGKDFLRRTAVTLSGWRPLLAANHADTSLWSVNETSSPGVTVQPRISVSDRPAGMCFLHAIHNRDIKKIGCPTRAA